MDLAKEKEGKELLESSLDDDQAWFDGFKAKDIVQRTEFSEDTKTYTSYLESIRLLSDGFSTYFLSGRVDKVDKATINSSFETKSLWSEVAKSLEAVSFGDANKEEAEKLVSIFENVANAELSEFKAIRDNKKATSSIFHVGTETRKRMDELDKEVQKCVERIQKRRKKVENAKILLDLRDQGKKYLAAIDKCDAICFAMSSHHQLVKDSYKHCFSDIKHILPHMATLAKNRQAALNGEKVGGGKDKEKDKDKEKKDEKEKQSKSE